MKKETRKFLGQFPPQSHFDKAHLKAYLKGFTHFFHGYRYDSQNRPIKNMDGSRAKGYFEVKQEYIPA